MKRDSEILKASAASSRNRGRRLLVALLLCTACGCNLLTPIIFIGEHQKRVLAEFDKLPQSKVAVHVWTEPATLFDYPHARFELGSYIADKLSFELEERELEVTVVDARDVEDFLQENVDAQVDPVLVGEKFDADWVIYVEVLRFQMRDPEEPQFIRGRISTSVVAHDMRADPGEPKKYDLAPVEAEFPIERSILASRANEIAVREGTYRLLAELVARKFYAYEEDL